MSRVLPHECASAPLVTLTEIAPWSGDLTTGATSLAPVSLSIHPGEVVVLAGANGIGKTTLVRCMLGHHKPASGKITRASDLRIAYLEQQDGAISDCQALTDTAIERLWRQQGELGEIALEILADDWRRFDDWQRLDGALAERRLDQWIDNFAARELLDHSYSCLSPGQKRKVDLIATLISDADLMILDEPLNHLDLQGITAFEESIAESRQRKPQLSIVLISHDRELIDTLADRTILLTREGAISVHGGYTTAHGEQQLRSEAQQHRAHEMRKQVQKLEAEFRQRMSWGHRKEASKRGAGACKPFIARRAKKMIKRAKEVERRHSDKLAELKARAPRRKRPVKIEVMPYSVAHRHVMTLAGVRYSYGDLQVLSGVDLRIDSHDRLALIGHNGAGKSTLVRLLLGHIEPSDGAVARNAGVNIGYLPQRLDDPEAPFFSGDTLFESFSETYRALADRERRRTVDDSRIRTMLASVGLRRERVHHPVDQLSHGERMRAALVFLVAQRFDFLVLDEPTSHIDLETIDVLEAMLSQLPGGYLVVSHDRRLIESCAESLYALDGGGLVQL